MNTLLLAFGKGTNPLGLVSIYNFLLSRLDLNQNRVDYLHLSDNIQKLHNYKGTKPDIIGITTDTCRINGCLKIVRLIRKIWGNVKIVVGGANFYDGIFPLYDEFINQIDHIVIGEGEKVMEKIIKGEIKNQIIIQGEPLTLSEYNSFPSFPNTSQITNQLPYLVRSNDLVGRILFNRGCPYNCVFCCDSRKRLLQRDPNECVYFLKHYSEKFKLKEVFIWDDVFTSNRKWLEGFRDSYNRYGLKIPLKVFIHAKAFNEEVGNILQECNVKQVSLGAESGNNRILDLINKHNKVEDYFKAQDLLKSKFRNIKLHCLWMLGNIGENKDTMLDTYKVAKLLGDGKPHFSFAIPFPGTKFSEVASEYGTIVNVNYSTWMNNVITFVPKDTCIEEMLQVMKLCQSIRR